MTRKPLNRVLVFIADYAHFIVLAFISIYFVYFIASTLSWRMDQNSPIVMYLAYLFGKSGYIPYRDVLSGEEMETSLEELADRSVNLGCRLVAAAHDYFTGTISREMCEETIVGESLHTGRLGKTMQDISHSASISNI